MSTKVKINFATVEELKVLKGVGPEMAKRIVERRDQFGFIDNYTQLQEVKSLKVTQELLDSIDFTRTPDDSDANGVFQGHVNIGKDESDTTTPWSDLSANQDDLISLSTGNNDVTSRQDQSQFQLPTPLHSNLRRSTGQDLSSDPSLGQGRFSDTSASQGATSNVATQSLDMRQLLKQLQLIRDDMRGLIDQVQDDTRGHVNQVQNDLRGHINQVQNDLRGHIDHQINRLTNDTRSQIDYVNKSMNKQFDNLSDRVQYLERRSSRSSPTGGSPRGAAGVSVFSPGKTYLTDPSLYGLGLRPQGDTSLLQMSPSKGQGVRSKIPVIGLAGTNVCRSTNVGQSTNVSQSTNVRQGTQVAQGATAQVKPEPGNVSQNQTQTQNNNGTTPNVQTQIRTNTQSTQNQNMQTVQNTTNIQNARQNIQNKNMAPQQTPQPPQLNQTQQQPNVQQQQQPNIYQNIQTPQPPVPNPQVPFAHTGIPPPFNWNVPPPNWQLPPPNMPLPPVQQANVPLPPVQQAPMPQQVQVPVAQQAPPVAQLNQVAQPQAPQPAVPQGNRGNNNNRHERETVPKTLSYDGKENWNAFETKFRRFAELRDWTPRDCKDNLCIVLKGAASEYFTVLNSRDAGLTFEDFMMKLKKRFGFSEIPETARVKFDSLKQNSDETLEAFADRVLQLATYAFTDIPDVYVNEKVIMRICHGIRNRDAGMHAANLHLTGVEDVLDKIKKFEYNHKAIFREKGKETREVKEISIDDDSEYSSDSESPVKVRETRVSSRKSSYNTGDRRARFSENSARSNPRKPILKSEKTTDPNSNPNWDTLCKFMGSMARSMDGLENLLKSQIRARSRSPSPRATQGCFLCGNQNHFIKDCPMKNGKNKQAPGPTVSFTELDQTNSEGSS